MLRIMLFLHSPCTNINAGCICSETRLVEITERLCEGKDYSCHSLIEDAEEHIESYWEHMFVLFFFASVSLVVAAVISLVRSLAVLRKLPHRVSHD